jgi:23S rRNA pseudouridine2605 synthase
MTTDSGIKLQKFMAEAGLASRRQAETWIAAGRVRVNGQMARVGDRIHPGRDRVTVDDKPVTVSEPRVVYVMNKPRGYVTTARDPEGRPTVLDLARHLPGRLFPVGRLDFHSEGLLLLTNDGALAHRLMHPSHVVPKTYLVKVQGRITPDVVRRLEQGVTLDDGPTAPARVENLRYAPGHSWFELTITEGRNRQVRRMCDAVGFTVARLIRIRVGQLELGRQRPGTLRLLTPQEIKFLGVFSTVSGVK